MGKLDAQVQPEYDYAGGAFEGNAFASEGRHSNLPLLSTGTYLNSWRYLRVKRWIDILGSLSMILISLIPALLIAVMIALTSEGPVFYHETRIGRGGRPFRIWKFRSMCTAKHWEEVVKAGSSGETFLHWRVHKNLCDPRITPLRDVAYRSPPRHRCRGTVVRAFEALLSRRDPRALRLVAGFRTEQRQFCGPSKSGCFLCTKLEPLDRLQHSPPDGPSCIRARGSEVANDTRYARRGLSPYICFTGTTAIRLHLHGCQESLTMIAHRGSNLRK
jgi:hypothetical protein